MPDAWMLGPQPAHAVTHAPVWPAQVQAVARVVVSVRAVWGGLGTVSGTVKLKGLPNVPVRRRVRLIRELDAVCVGEVWSDAVTGAYAFPGIDPAIAYTVLAYDGPRVLRAAVQDGVVPVVAP